MLSSLSAWIVNLQQADVDGDGALNYGEFVAISVHLRKLVNDEYLHKAFAFFDLNKSGYIEPEELRAALSGEDDSNSDEVINAIMHDVDTDKVITHHHKLDACESWSWIVRAHPFWLMINPLVISCFPVWN